MKKKSMVLTTIILLGLIAFSFALSPKTLQNDTFYTIKIGEYIKDNGIENLTTDPFSWHQSLPYTFPHWAYDLAIYLVYALGGQTGIYLSTIVLASILALSLYFANQQVTKNKIISAVIAFIAMYLLKDYIAARAQLVTFILFVWTNYCINRFLEKTKLRYAIILVLIPFAIANLHVAVWPFYFVLFLPAIAEYMVAVLIDFPFSVKIKLFCYRVLLKFERNEEKEEKLKEKIETLTQKAKQYSEKLTVARNEKYRIKVEKNKAVILLVVIMLIALATGLLTPIGDAPYTYLYKTMQGNTTESINEHQPLTLIDHTSFICVLIFFCIFFIFTKTRFTLRDFFMFLGLLYLSFLSRRQVSIFVIINSIFACKLLIQLINKEGREKIEQFFTSILGIMILSALIISITILEYEDKIYDPYIDESSYPVQAVEWIQQNLDINQVRFYNEYNYGSYLLFKGIPVFIDSRADLYAPEFNTPTGNKDDGKDIFSDAMNIAGISTYYETKFEEYGITHVIAYSNSKLVMLLSHDDRYEELYKDDTFSIYQRKSAKVDESWNE